jgi:NAD(P)-dependent dehydrogenase (short-subunit alcohol dehydrogenase family)
MTGPFDVSDPEDVNALYRRVIEQYGWESQADNVVEEAAELIFAICKHKRKAAKGEFKGKRLDAVVEEIADLEIALGQAKLIYCGQSPEAEKAFEAVKRRKLEKLAAKLDVR